MEVLVLIALLCVVSSEFAHDLSHIEAFVNQRRYSMRKKYRPYYHITTPVGWLNDPAAMIEFKNQYHIFYQYHPYNGAWGPMHWGHVVSNNLVDWVYYPAALVPKEFYEKHGCYAGSAYVHNSYLTLFYTGNVMSNNKTYQTQNMAISADGIIFQKYLYNPVIRQAPFDNGNFRNPKIWRFHSTFYMIIGTSSFNQRGQIVLYTSPDIVNWKFNRTLAESYGDMGTMWENPDLFEMNGLHVLIMSVQGIQPDEYRFRNLYQTGYIVGKFNHLLTQFEEMEISTETFNELDHGHDFYAAQTMQTSDGRRLLIAWLGMWESDFEESTDGWASMLTLVRELKMSSEGKLLMTPVSETIDLRAEILEDAWYSPGESFTAGAKSFEMIVNTSSVLADANLVLEWNGEARFSLGYSSDYGYVSIDRGGVDGIRRADWSPIDHIHWRIFVDSSSVEVFCGAGEVVFTSRIYPKKSIRIVNAGSLQLHVIQYRLKRSVGYDSSVSKYLKSHVMTNYGHL